MKESPDESRPPKFLENGLLLVVGVVCLSVLQYQLPRWVHGLDPTFVHPKWLEQSHLPILLKLARIHPIIWIALVIAVFTRICWNYAWKLSK